MLRSLTNLSVGRLAYAPEEAEQHLPLHYELHRLECQTRQPTQPGG
jgi:hypothetical protein